MRFFVYISPTKVEMLHAQTKRTYFDKIKMGLKLKLGLIEASIDGETNSGILYDKVEEVRNALLADAGTVERPKTYIDDVAELALHEITDYAAGIAVFSGRIKGKGFVMIGSAGSLIGAPVTPTQNRALGYYDLKFIEQYLDHPAAAQVFLQKKTKPLIVYAAEEALKDTEAEVRRYSFLARVMFKSKKLLIATPISVAYAD